MMFALLSLDKKLSRTHIKNKLTPESYLNDIYLSNGLAIN